MYCALHVLSPFLCHYIAGGADAAWMRPHSTKRGGALAAMYPFTCVQIVGTQLGCNCRVPQSGPSQSAANCSCSRQRKACCSPCSPQQGLLLLARPGCVGDCWGLAVAIDRAHRRLDGEVVLGRLRARLSIEAGVGVLALLRACQLRGGPAVAAVSECGREPCASAPIKQPGGSGQATGLPGD